VCLARYHTVTMYPYNLEISKSTVSSGTVNLFASQMTNNPAISSPVPQPAQMTPGVSRSDLLSGKQSHKGENYPVSTSVWYRLIELATLLVHKTTETGHKYTCRILRGNWEYGVTKSHVFIVLYKHYFPQTVERLLQTLALDLTRQEFSIIRPCIVYYWRRNSCYCCFNKK